MVEEKNMAKYAKSKEFEKIKNFCADRISFYQTCLPDGRPVDQVNLDGLDKNWQVANIVIREFTALMGVYEQAQTTVDEANGRP